MADDFNKEQLEEYKNYLEKLVETKAPDVFSNGGIEHASILMSVLLRETNDIARVYCHGFKPELITTDPYWPQLDEYLEDGKHKLLVLVECADYMEQEPLLKLKKAIHDRGDNSVQVKLISKEGKDLISERFGKGHCNFAIFDDNKFRFEFDPEHFKAFGSFNQPRKCEVLTDLFDRAFGSSDDLWKN